MERCAWVAILLACMVPATVLARGTDGPDLSAVVAQLRHEGDAVLAAYTPEQGVATALALSRLYFDVFEGGGMEAAIGRHDHARKADLEAHFSTVIGLASRGRPHDEVMAAWLALRTGLEHAANDGAQAEWRLRIISVGSGLLLLLALVLWPTVARGLRMPR